MLEWLKRLIWKVSNRQKRFGSSNLPHSASGPMRVGLLFYIKFQYVIVLYHDSQQRFGDHGVIAE